jgi:hypothetical protein
MADQHLRDHLCSFGVRPFDVDKGSSTNDVLFGLRVLFSERCPKYYEKVFFASSSDIGDVERAYAEGLDIIICLEIPSHFGALCIRGDYFVLYDGKNNYEIRQVAINVLKTHFPQKKLITGYVEKQNDNTTCGIRCVVSAYAVMTRTSSLLAFMLSIACSMERFTFSSICYQ